ncbi:MAG: hypothetical protein REI11_20350, partial [Patulibacter sp.]|nr:hypothetical protein [Patulibacter sp.]
PGGRSMISAAVLAASSSSDHTILQNIGEVVLVGSLAGVGIAIAFSLMIRGFLVAGTARREGRSGVWAANAAMGAIFAVVCVAAVVGAIAVMLQH